MAMDIDPFSMLEVSLQEDPDPDERRHGSSAGVMHQMENDVQIVQPPPPFQYMGNDVLTPQRAVLNNIQKLALTSKEEEKFRRRAYSSISLVLRKRLHCTICDAHIGAYLGLKEMDIEHPLLKVLACSKCTLKYHYLEFPLNPDGRDIRCRWCTESAKEESPLRFCSYCPFAFCEMCIYRNLPLDELASNKNNWICFVCNVKDLWPSRAVLWALRVLIDTNLALKEERKWSTDQSTCCKNKTTKQRRHVTLPAPVIQPLTSQNGHNQPPPLRTIAPAQVNNFRSALKNPVRYVAPQRVVRPILPIMPTRAMPMSSQNSTTQLYDTAWLTEKVQSISTTLLNLNNNLHRIAQGIPEKENKYSIKSKMISMVSLLNISATQLQKASKEMEEESKKILDKNYKVAKVTPVSLPSTITTPSVPVRIAETKVVLKPIVIEKVTPKISTMPARNRKRSYSSSGRKKRFKVSSEYDSEYEEEEEEEEEDFDDPDFQVRTLPEGEGPRTRLRTRACFVKLERLDEKMVDDLKSEASDDLDPRPSTSKAPDPLGTVGPEELKAITGDDGPKENGECGNKQDVEIDAQSEEQEKAPASADGSEAVTKDSSQPAAEDSSEPSAEDCSEPAAEDSSEPAAKESSQAPDKEVSPESGAGEDGSQLAAEVVLDHDSQSASKESSHSPPKAPSPESADVDDDSQPAVEAAAGSGSQSAAEAAPSDDSQPAPKATSGDDSQPSVEATSSDDSQPVAKTAAAADEDSRRDASADDEDSRPAAADDHSQPPNASAEDESQSVAADDDSQPAAAAEEESCSSAQQNPQPATDDAVPDSGSNGMNASEPSPKAPHKDVSDPAADLDGPEIDAPGDDPLNESSATESSITDSSTTSAETSDS